MGGSYLMICSSLSLGAIGFAIFERFLQATGKNNDETVIFPCIKPSTRLDPKLLNFENLCTDFKTLCYTKNIRYKNLNILLE